MLTGVTDGIFCCLLGAPPNAVGPLESVESSDGYTFVEVKPGRVLRVKHAGPAPAPTPPPPLSDAAQGDQSGLVTSFSGFRAWSLKRISTFRPTFVIHLL